MSALAAAGREHTKLVLRANVLACRVHAEIGLDDLSAHLRLAHASLAREAKSASWERDAETIGTVSTADTEARSLKTVTEVGRLSVASVVGRRRCIAALSAAAGTRLAIALAVAVVGVLVSFSEGRYRKRCCHYDCECDFQFSPL